MAEWPAGELPAGHSSLNQIDKSQHMTCAPAQLGIGVISLV